MKYFRFEIPLNADGTRVSYSPGWHGTMDKCPSKVTVSLYNDKEGYGIAQVEDCTLPKEVTALSKADHDKMITEASAEQGVYIGAEAISARPEWNPEPIKEDLPVDFDAGFESEVDFDNLPDFPVFTVPEVEDAR